MWRVGARAVVLLIVIVSALVLAGPAEGSMLPAAEAGGGSLAVAALNPVFKSRNIYVVTSDGDVLRELAAGVDPFFAWSPSGGQLVFSREGNLGCAGCSDLYVVGAGGGTPRLLTSSGTSANPAWSASGKLIAFDRCRNVANGPCAIFTIAPDGRGLRRLTPWAVGYSPPVWSPNNKTLAFSGILKRGIYTVGSNGRSMRRLTRDGDEDPVFSPDGAELAFTRQTPIGPMEARSDIYVMSPDGKGLRRLTSTGTQNYEPAWSPDGRLIAFIEAQRNNSPSCGEDAVAVMTPTGGGRRRLTGFGLYEKPLWSDNEQQLAVVGEETQACPPAEGERALYVLSADGTGQRRVTQLRIEAAGGLAWRPEF